MTASVGLMNTETASDTPISRVTGDQVIVMASMGWHGDGGGEGKSVIREDVCLFLSSGSEIVCQKRCMYKVKHGDKTYT